MKILDFIAVGTALVLTIISFVMAMSGQGDSLEVRIEADGREWLYPLDEELDLIFTGPVGDTSVMFHEGTVKVSHSDCREQICVQAGEIDGSGEWIACMPNRVFISVQGKDEGGLDGESY